MSKSWKACIHCLCVMLPLRLGLAMKSNRLVSPQALQYHSFLDTAPFLSVSIMLNALLHSDTETCPSLFSSKKLNNDRTKAPYMALELQQDRKVRASSCTL